MTASGPGIKSALAEKQDGICPWCRLPLPDELAYMTALDHIIPRSRGGPDKRWNHQLLHLQCNREKGSKFTPAAVELAARHGIVLREPLPTAWPGSSVKLGSGKPNPYSVEPAPPPAPIAPGGDCLCGRGEAAGTLTWTSGRMNFRAFHDGPAYWHHEHSVDWACLDCVADTAAAIASGQVREDMRRIGRQRSA